MLTLLLLRHAKSSWDDPKLEDHERPLAKRGVKDAPKVGAYIAEYELKPDYILCSDAVRTRATLTLIMPEWSGAPPETEFDEDLYLATPTTLLEAIRSVPSTARTLMVIGHNPGLHAVALELVGAGDRKLIASLAKGFPTASLAVLTFEAEDWAGVKSAGGRLRYFVSPKQIV